MNEPLACAYGAPWRICTESTGGGEKGEAGRRGKKTELIKQRGSPPWFYRKYLELVEGGAEQALDGLPPQAAGRDASQHGGHQA